jgi:hypothetical protein
MTQRIIYSTDDGGVAIIIPAPECLQEHTIEEIAAKDVPVGKPYKIVDVTDIPEDRTFRNAWTVDEEDLTDGVGSEHNVFITDPQHPNYVAPVSEEQE